MNNYKNYFYSIGLLVGLLITGAGVFLMMESQPAKASYDTGDRVQAMQDFYGELSTTSNTSSTKDTDVPNALPKANFHSNYMPMLIDMNGDGLTDMVYSRYISAETYQYVLLNTGDGFEFAYTCLWKGSPKTYRGTCANL